MGAPLLCVTVTGRTMAEIRRAREAAVHANLVEVRLDGVDRPDAAAALADRRCPTIVTCRPSWEGGLFTGAEEERRRILEAAIALGAEFVDVEAAAPFAADLIRARAGRGIVLSAHCFGPLPRDLRERYAALRSSSAEVVKLAANVERLSELLPFLSLADTQPAHEGPAHVLIAMGAAGVCSRILSARLGNCWTYAGNGVAPGQLPAGRLLREFRYQRIRADAALYGIAGNPVAHSLSPAMHNAGFAALGRNAVYVPLHASDADDFVRFARAAGLSGASITAPLKVALLPAMDRVDSLARRVGAVNTLVVDDGRWLGFNTDVEGFLAPLEKRIRLKGARATVLGAGGAARAAAVALSDRGAAVTISARRPEAAAPIVEAGWARLGKFPPAPGTWDVLVNATPAGGPAMPVNPIPGTALDGEAVFDLVYSPAITPLMAAAAEQGCSAIGGLEMLVAQAERQFELWTGQRPPVDLYSASAARATLLSEEGAPAPGVP